MAAAVFAGVFGDGCCYFRGIFSLQLARRTAVAEKKSATDLAKNEEASAQKRAKQLVANLPLVKNQTLT